MATTISKSFTATGVGATLSVKFRDSFTYSVSGTFSGTVILERTNNGGQSFEPTGVTATGTASGTVLSLSTDQGQTSYRFRCSVYSSGTIVTSIADADLVINRVENSDGVALFEVTEGGLLIGSGSATTLALAFSLDTDTGLYRSGSNSLILVVGGSNAAAFGTTGVDLYGQIRTGASLNTGVSMLELAGNTLAGVNQRGIMVDFTGSAAATSDVIAINTRPKTFIGSQTTVHRCGLYHSNETKGAGSTISYDNGVFVEVPTQGTTGNAILTDNLAYSGSWAINLASTSKSTFAGQVIAKGTATNDSAAAGYVGEVLAASRLKSAATSATTATSLNVTAAALSLTAGDWDVSGAVGFLGAAGTSVTLLKAAISLTTATLPATDTLGVPTSGECTAQFSTAANVIGATDFVLPIQTTRISVAGTTSIFLVANATFTVSTLTVYGSLNARRVR